MDVSEKHFVNKKRFEDITMREIARQADVSVGALYLHFKTKEDIIATLLADFTLKQVDEMESSVPKEGSGAQRFNALLTFYDRLCQDPYFILFGRILFFHTIDTTKIEKLISIKIIESANRFLTFATEIIETGMSDGSIRARSDPKLLSRVLIDTFSSLMLSIALRNNFSSLSPLAKDINSETTFSILRTILSDGLMISATKDPRGD